MKKIRVAAFLLLCVLLSAVLITVANSTQDYLLYRNDTEFSLPEYPVEMLDSELYVPSSFFIGLDNINYEYLQKEKSYYFMNTETGRYFSASMQIGSILVDGEFVEKSFPLLNSTTYLPLEYCADILSLAVEIKTDGKVTRIRVTDGTQTLTFNELVELFEPEKEPDTPPSEEKPPVVLPPVLDPPEVVPVTEKKTVYLILSTDETSGLSEMLDSLRGFGERGTVFFTEEALDTLPKEVLHTLVNSNALALSASSVDKLNALNNTLTLISNTSTRICDLSALDEEDAKKAIEAGYIPWQTTIDCNDYSDISSWTAAEQIYKKALEKKRCAVSISCDKKNLNLLASLLGIFSNDEEFVLSVINSATPEINDK